MQVSAIMTSNPEMCTPDETCAVAGEIMRRRSCGFVPVVESRDTRFVVGVITDRDLALYLTQKDRRPSEVLVDQCMTRWPKTVAPETDLQEAAQLMEAYGTHRLPVVQYGQLVGVLSVTDIARLARKLRRDDESTPAERQLADLVESLSSPH